MTAPSPLPPAPEPALQTAARLLAEGRPDEAAAHLSALVAGAPTYAAAHVLYATALEAAGRPAKALDAWSHAAFLVPRSPLIRRERQRLAALFAPLPDETAVTASVDEFMDVPLPEPDEPAAWAPEPDEPEPRAPEAAADPDEAISPDPEPFDGPTIEGLPLESLATLFETDTPLFEDDDEDDEPAPTADEAAGAAAEPVAPAAEPSAPAPVPDWGDLPPIAAPLLPPDATVAPPSPAPPATPPEPNDWRVLETTDAADDAPGLSFDRPVGASAPADAPEASPADAPAAGDDLDALISSLEQAPRIRPDPAFSGPDVRPDESGVDEMVSETLAKIYAAQHRYVEAAVMYEKLAAREPARADAMLRQAAELRERRGG